jgi:type II secretion system (T2SS) protein N
MGPRGTDADALKPVAVAPRRWVVVATVVVAAAIAAIALAPPALLDARVDRLSAGAVRLLDTSGSVWRGRGVLAAGTTRTPIAWRIEAWPLVWRELRLRIAAPSAESTAAPRGAIVIAADRVTLADVDVALPAAVIATLAAPQMKLAWTPGGEVGLRVDAMEWAPPASRGVALLSWRSARLAGPGGFVPLDLGTLTATLTAAGDRLSGPVANAGGDLSVTGTIDARAHESLRVTLALAPRRRDDALLAPLLAAIGREQSGEWHVEWRVPLR